MSDFGDGLKFGAGAYLGWLVVKWGIGILLLLIICGTVIFFAFSRITKEDISNANRDQVTHKVNCTIRSKPTRGSRAVGTAKAWDRLFVTDKKDGWLKVELPNGHVGWSGCVERIIYHGSSTGSTTVDI